MTNQYCSRCGKDLPLGSIKYILSIRLYADFDGVVEEGAGKEMDDIEYLLRCLEDSHQDETENDVHGEMAFLLCKDCRDRFSRDPLNKRVGDGSDKERYHGILH